MPDLNSVPPSPRPLAASRHNSQHQLPSPPPGSSSPSLNILPSNQNAVNPSTTTSTTQSTTTQSSTPSQSAQAQSAAHFTSPRDGPSSLESGPGPLRHPRPLTASEMHIQLEKEQEAVVNRLTRELSLLRAAQNASVASNHSSTSATTSTHEVSEPSLLTGSGFTIPTSRRHRRTSSTTTSQSLVGPHDVRHPVPARPVPLSRQDSTTSRHSRAESPIPHGSLDLSSHAHQQRMPPPPYIPTTSAAHVPGHSDQLSPGMMPATARYEETLHFRGELEAAKKENDALKRRVKELERRIQERRSSDAGRPRSTSVSTTASVSVAPSGGTSIAGPRDGQQITRDRGMTSQSSLSTVGVGVPEDEVAVGESAATTRLASGET